MFYLYSPTLSCLSFYASSRICQGGARRNITPTPPFRRRRGVTPSTFSPSLTYIPILTLDPPCIEDEEVSPHDADLRPGKMKVVDEGDGVPVVVNLSGTSPKAVEHGPALTLAEGDARVTSEMSNLAELYFAASPRPDDIVETIGDNASARPGCEEASPSRPIQEDSHVDKGKN